MAACLVVASACAGRATAIPRVLDAQPTLGVFVSPHQYEWFVRGELALAADDLDAAAAAFEQARLGPQDDVLIIVRLAEVELRRGRTARAQDLVTAARALDPQNESVFLMEGSIAESQSDDARAKAAYEAAITAAPSSDRGPLALSRLLVRVGQAPEAIAVLEALETRARGSLAADRARFELALTSEEATTLDAATHALLARSPGAEDRVLEAARALLDTRADLALVLVDALPAEEESVALRVAALARLRRVDDLEGALAHLAIAPEQAASLWLVAHEPRRALEALDGAGDDATTRCVRKRTLTALGRVDEARRLEVAERCVE